MKKTFLYALRRSVPIFVSWVPVGLAYGVLMQSSGYNFIWTGISSISIYAGSLQYLMVSFLAGSTSYLTVAVMALLLNSRHIFYGLPYIEKFRDFGGWKYYLIYALTDECFSLYCSKDFGKGVNEKWAYIFTAALLAFYWTALSVTGALIGSLITFNTAGIDFALTALFIIIFIEQVETSETAIPAILAFCSAVICLAVLGADHFILPSLIFTVLMLMLLRKHIEKRGAENEN